MTDRSSALLRRPLSSSIPLYVSNPDEQMGGGGKKGACQLVALLLHRQSAPPPHLASRPTMLFPLLSAHCSLLYLNLCPLTRTPLCPDITPLEKTLHFRSYDQL